MRGFLPMAQSGTGTIRTMTDETDLATRPGLSDALRVLLDEYPRDGWTDDPGFDGLIRFWLDRHVMFRRLLAEMTAQTERMLDRSLDPQRFGAVLSRYGGMFVNGLHEHHTIEDTHYFPVLSQKDSRLTHGFAILDRDHHAIDRYLADFVDAANGAIGQIGPGADLTDPAGALHRELGLLTRLLDRHLTDEEELIVPVILKFGAD